MPFAESLRVYRPRYRSNVSFAVKVARPGKHRWQGFSARNLWNAIQKVAVRWFSIGKRSGKNESIAFAERYVQVLQISPHPCCTHRAKIFNYSDHAWPQLPERKNGEKSCTSRTIIIIIRISFLDNLLTRIIFHNYNCNDSCKNPEKIHEGFDRGARRSSLNK